MKQNLVWPRSALLFAMMLAAFVGALVVGRGAAAQVMQKSGTPTAPGPRQPVGVRLQANSLCAVDEQIIFSCVVKRTAKLISLCGSARLTKDTGYLQYRFGLPAKVELEFPKERPGSLKQFHYTHYFRFQVDLTEVNFAIDDYQYSVFDSYNGEEKPAISNQGVTVTAPGKTHDVTFPCRTKPKADYSALADILPNDNH